jgi:hypothetical protein
MRRCKERENLKVQFMVIRKCLVYNLDLFTFMAGRNCAIERGMAGLVDGLGGGLIVGKWSGKVEIRIICEQI